MTIDVPFKKLNFHVQNFADLQAAVNKLSNSELWIDHANHKDYQGHWQVLAIRGLTSHQNAHPILQAFQIHNDNVQNYCNFPVIKQLPDIEILLQQLSCGVLSARLMKLSPGARINEHRDHGLCFSKGLVRLHLCLSSNDNVVFTIAGQEVIIREGELWYLNADEPHAIANNSEENRIHLVIDCLSNDWLQSLIGLPFAPTLKELGIKQRQQWLTDLGSTLLNQQSPQPDEIRRATQAFASGLAEYLELDILPDHHIDDAFTMTQKGKAISPLSAAICAKEHLRTARFLQGIHQAIEDKLADNDVISILYAGTGPFATLLLPLMLFLESERIHITFLDIHQPSLDSLQRLLNLFELNHFSYKTVCADACQWQPAETFDIIISETMKAALVDECQVSIFKNLFPALKQGGVLIPERVTLEAFAVSEDHSLHPLGEICQLCQDSVQKLAKGNLRALDNTFTVDCGKTVTAILIETHIHVYDDITLGKLECSLNIPVTIARKSDASLKAISLAYQFGERPGYQLIEHQ